MPSLNKNGHDDGSPDKKKRKHHKSKDKCEICKERRAKRQRDREERERIKQEKQTSEEKEDPNEEQHDAEGRHSHADPHQKENIRLESIRELDSKLGVQELAKKQSEITPSKRSELVAGDAAAQKTLLVS